MHRNLVNQRFNNLQEEFEAKNEILSSKFLGLSSEEYFEEIFPDKKENDEIIIVLGTLKDKKGNIVEKGTVTRVKVEDIWKITWRSNAYIPYCDFRRNFYHSRTLKRVRAFVVDIDNLTSLTLRRFLRFNLKQIPTPTYIVNSGKGVHFVYKLSKPQEVKGFRWTLNKINNEIQNLISHFVEVDKHSLFQPYRFPGFLTKINTIATAFKLRKSYTLEELMGVLKVRKPKGIKKKEKKSKKAEVFYIPNGSIHFYDWFCSRLFLNPPIPGRRHNSFFALGIVSYKCRRVVPKDEAEEVVYMVYEIMENKNLHIGFSLKEALDAYHKGYNLKYVRASWKYLCSLLGWEYRANKRNGRTREEHLRLARKIRSIYAEARRKEKEEHIKRLISKGYNKSEIAEMLGISRQNLYKTYGYLFK